MENKNYKDLTETEKQTLRKQRFLAGSNINTIESSKVGIFIITIY